ncbi:unnamed protein product [Dracunculus medinensis]|uniref:ANK_REP_REGION domain-containing protein n=1 Tax=Dracunculus medinensis TaxID=318479 RepID=A0A0N4UCI9_DRAME|nr:unnamed protein product [Dracunculus medinensis]
MMIKYLKLLLNNGAKINDQDRREKRTALMYACLEDSRTDEGIILLNMKNCKIQIQDRLGNTAVMYAAMKGRNELMEEIIRHLSMEWSLAALQLKNCMGHTAEDLAIRNGNHRCARIVQSQRLHMLSCMNHQLIMMGRIGCRHWGAFTALYKCADKLEFFYLYFLYFK